MTHSLTNQQLQIFLRLLGSELPQKESEISVGDLKKEILCWKSDHVRVARTVLRVSDLYFQGEEGGRLSDFVSVLVRSELRHIAQEISNNTLHHTRAGLTRAY